jgi:large subunit ribosomal protein L15
MKNLSNLKPAKGAVKQSKRVGRGEGTGNGDTAGKGHKGQQSRSGYSRRFGHEGGQMPIYRRLPKFGFKNINRVEYRSINIDTLQLIAEKNNIDVITPEVLIANGVIGKKDLFKILGRGEIKSKLDVTAHAFSATAIKAIESLGGTATKI